jgi:UDP-N-acetylmuramoyl-tripeptide--D-alanyl-D-alanine ligase
MSAVLSQKYKTLYTLGNLNNHIGVPLTLLRLNDEYEFAVIEMGANHPGEIKTLCSIAEPDYGLITNVGKGHLEGFGSFEGVIRTKGELYDFIRAKKGLIFINHENDYLQNIAGGIDKKEYGKTPGLYVSGQVTNCSPFLSFEWNTEEGESTSVETKLVGEYNLENALAAITAGVFFGVDTSLINKAVNEYRPQNNRSQLKKTDRNSLIIDAYNANPTSMTASVSNFAKMNSEKKALILGDMLELGDQSDEEHQKIIDLLNKSGFEKVFLIGDLFSKTNNRYRSFHAVDDFISEIPDLDLTGYTILIKGSRALKLERTIDHL